MESRSQQSNQSTRVTDPIATKGHIIPRKPTYAMILRRIARFPALIEASSRYATKASSGSYAASIRNFKRTRDAQRKKVAAATAVAEKRASTPLRERYEAASYVSPRESTVADGPAATMAERQIERAMREGEFNNLKGAGKPLSRPPKN